VRNAVIGVIVAATLALSLAGASIFGIAFWKIALAALGAVIFVVTGVKDKTGTRR
jgi:membrane-bound ClpP family serine protease